MAQKVAVIGLNHVSSPDGFTFLATENLAVNEVIYFTENEYDNVNNKFNDLGESVVKFTVTSAISKGNVVYVAETGVTTDVFTVTTSEGAGAAIKTSGSGNFSIATAGESLYAYTDTDDNPTNGITEIYAVLYTGTSSVSGGNIPAIENPVPDFANAIVVHGFPATAPSRVEYKTSVADRTNVSKAKLENINNYVYAQAHQALSTTVFTNLNLSGVNPVLTVNATGSPVAENSGNSITYTFSLNTPATSNITVNFSVGGTAVFGSDYSQSGANSFSTTSGSVIISNGNSSASVTITPINEISLEANESIVLTATSGTGYDVGSPSNAVGQITNDDTLAVTPLVAVTGMNHQSGGPKGFSFVVLKDLTAGQVIYFTENSFVNTALAFTGTEAVIKWTVPAGGISRGKVVAVKETTANTYVVSCSAGSSCGAINHISGSFSPSSEGESFFAYTDSDNNHTNGVTEVHSVLVTGRSAIAGPGGAIATSENIALLYTGAVVVDNFPTINPNRVEYNPALRNTTVDQANFQNTANWLHAQVNQDLSTTPFSSIIISEGASNPTVSVTVSPSSVEELNTSNLTYTFTLSTPATSNITINFDVSGSAAFTTDYTVANANTFSASSGSIVIANGASSASLTVTPVNDTVLEPEEEVILTLSSGTGYNGGSPHTATGKITNNDINNTKSSIAILGLNHDTPDGFSFVATEDIAPSTRFYFTDNDFNNTSLTFSSTEAVITYTSPATCVAKGTVFTVKETATDVLSLACTSGNCGAVSLTGNFSVSSTGEAFYVYQDTDNNPSNGITQVHGVLYTKGGNIPSVNNPKNIYTKAVVIDGFPTTAPNKTEFKVSNRNAEVTTALLENVSNWDHAQTNTDLSTANFTTQPFVAKTIYVDDNATSGGDGKTWGTAYNTLQDALANTNPCVTDKIWVATGIYKPTAETSSFNIPANVEIYGGFLGNETNLADRNWSTYPTVLSGDLNNNYTAEAGDAHTIVTITNSNITLDGFIIEYSFADDSSVLPGRTGAGMYINASPRPDNININNTTFRYNNAVGNNATTPDGVGGAVISYGTNISFTNCLFHNNEVTNAGGAISPQLGSNLKITNCTFASNSAVTGVPNPSGGAIHIFNVDNVDITNTIFSGNVANTNPDINNHQGTNVNLSYSVLTTNSLPTTPGGGSGVVTVGAEVLINTNPLFIDEGNKDYRLQNSSQAKDKGSNAANTKTKDLAGNDRIFDTTIDIGAYENICSGLGTIFYVNINAGVNGDGKTWGTAFKTLQQALTQAQACNNITEIWVAKGTYKPTTTDNRTIAFTPRTNLKIYGGFAGGEANLVDRNWTTNPTILSGDIGTESVITDNSSTVVHLQNGNIVIDGFIIENGNADHASIQAERFGAGVYMSGDANNNQITNCIIRNNNGVSGIGLANFATTITNKVILTNTLIHNNIATHSGGAIGAEGGTTNLVNCTVVNNTAPVGEALRAFNGNFDAVNTIFASNNGNTVFSVLGGGTGNMTYSYCSFDVAFPTTAKTTNNGNSLESTNPRFTNSGASDFSLQVISPLINIGNDAVNTETKDFIGNTREVGIIDIGAYEYKDETTRWKGTDTNWSTASNWSNNEPTETKTAIIPNGAANMPIITTGAKKVLGLFIDTNASLALQSQTSLTAEDDVTTNNKLTINSDATFIAKGNVLGTITYKRAVSDKWHLIGAPVENQSIQTFVQNVDNKVDINTAGDKYGIAPYNNNKPSDQVGWDYVLVANLATSGDFISGKGYSMLRSEAGDYTFTGNYKTTDASISINEGTKNSWNLIANPYPAFLPISNAAAVSNFLTENQGVLSSNLAVYLWDGTQYQPYNHLNTSTAYLAPGQGFFVKSNVGGGTISIPKSFMSHQTTNVFHRSSDTRFQIILQLEQDEKSKKTSKSTTIIYVNGTTTGLDIGYDAEVFSAESKQLDIYSSLVEENGKRYALQGLPPSNFEEMIVPIGVIAKANKKLSFKLQAKNVPSNLRIYLEDKETKTFTRLDKEGSEYIIETTTDLDEVGRFYLHTTSKTLSIDDNFTNANIQMYVSGKRTLTIKGLNGETSTLKLYDLLGKEIFKETFRSVNTKEITLPNSLSQSMYIAKLRTASGNKTIKLILE
ncbi:hypothetical protein WH52_02520 [Tenacibaculum holothuriorum]|uniref:Calx-beta domain-containing protein n=2 Tax=Tenacibaculum holothuriorum TaxID=1635173 RepID=A0A1Y2PGA8_9FLAO|nr:hypothetical protein WH52_02520 [Tenacibaculum holothuriorum]